jgi:transglutaminase-like putative cysteine protease
MSEGKKNRETMTKVLLYLLGFLLLWEWLRPVDTLTETGNIFIFLGFIFLCLVISFSKTHWLIGTLSKIVYILYCIHHYYFEGSFFQFSWLSAFVTDLILNMGYSFEMEWTSFTFVFRSLLFFILLWLMSYLMHYWLIIRRQIFIFFFMTLVYITVLDTFTPYEADGAIVRTIVIGFGVMGMLTYQRLVEREAIVRGGATLRKWALPLLLMIGASVAFGFGGPKAEPIWPDPVPYLTSYSEDSGEGSGGQRVGYGTDDTHLGGPFVGDDAVVYETEVDQRHYWKVETKDIYTGKGWEVFNPEAPISFSQDETVPITSFTQGIELKEASANVTSIRSYQHIIYPLGLKSVVTDDVSFSFELNKGLEKVYSLEGEREAPLEEYSVTYDIPRYSVTAMKATTGLENAGLSQEFINQYTQLPESLPQRVKDLALEITAEQDTWFDKARAVERYFGMNGFTYNQVDVAVPGPNDDYVDQFLFETLRGYCDNYSTSMVVLLRSLGIPSRWAKGYTEGEYQGPTESGKRGYTITNNNAHSWVEVYFPGVGWVPFEPTQGFSNNVQLNFDEVSEASTDVETPETEEKPEVEKPDPLEETTSTESSFSWKGFWTAIEAGIARHWDKGLIVLAIVGIAVWIAYKLQLKWLPFMLVFAFRFRKKDEDFSKAYLALLKQLDRYGIKRREHQTLRDYADYVDSFFSSKDMGTLTSQYERYVYKGTLEEGSWDRSRELWENLIKKTIA